jgi:hypothetical protein
MSWVDRGRDAGRVLKEIEVKDLREQLDVVRDYLRELTALFQQDRQPPMRPCARARRSLHHCLVKLERLARTRR